MLVSLLSRLRVKRASGSRGLTPPRTSRAPHRAGDYGRVDQRAALDDEAARVELPVDLSQEPRRQAKLVDRLAKPPDRGVVERLHAQRQAVRHGGTTAGRAPPPRRRDRRACAIAAEERS